MLKNEENLESERDAVRQEEYKVLLKLKSTIPAYLWK